MSLFEVAMSTFFRKLFVVIVFTGVIGHSGAAENSAIPALSGPADWMLLFCGLVIGVVIVLRRLTPPGA